MSLLGEDRIEDLLIEREEEARAEARRHEAGLADAILATALAAAREVLVEAGVAGAPATVALEGVAAGLAEHLGISIELARAMVRLALRQEAAARGVAPI